LASGIVVDSGKLCYYFMQYWYILCYCVTQCAYCTGESSVRVKIEADSNDITDHPHADKPRPYVCTVCGKRFTTKNIWNSTSKHTL